MCQAHHHHRRHTARGTLVAVPHTSERRVLHLRHLTHRRRILSVQRTCRVCPWQIPLLGSALFHARYAAGKRKRLLSAVQPSRQSRTHTQQLCAALAAAVQTVSCLQQLQGATGAHRRCFCLRCASRDTSDPASPTESLTSSSGRTAPPARKGGERVARKQGEYTRMRRHLRTLVGGSSA